MDSQKLIAEQRRFFETGKTRDLSFRRDALKRLRQALLSNEQRLSDALNADLGKSAFEVITTEIGMITKEISLILKKLKRWDRRRPVATNLFNLPGKSYILREPYGNTLIIGPWNYPVQLTLGPLVGAIAGGNTAILKPSELSPNTSNVMADIISSNFPPEYISVVLGAVPETQELLDQRFDMIFFTGSPAVGKIVMEKGAKHLSKVVLELGGKSPCIVDESAKLDVAVKRIIFGKASNAGQTCVAPDYVLIHASRLDEFVRKFSAIARRFYGENMIENDAYGKLINQRHYQRVKSYLGDGEVLFGGGYDDAEEKIELTLLKVDDSQKPVMQEEIFGPVLPVITYEQESDIYDAVAAHPDPLALYVFSSNRPRIERILHRIPFGGGCVNDTIMHLSNEHLPFGGRGTSGQGNYHGRRSYEAFTHEKSVFQNGTVFDLALKYPPYNKRGIKLVKKLMY